MTYYKLEDKSEIILFAVSHSKFIKIQHNKLSNKTIRSYPPRKKLKILTGLQPINKDESNKYYDSFYQLKLF